MARIESIVWRLRNWERWRVSMAGNGLGYARQSVFLCERALSDREIRIPVDEVEASVTNDAVESFKETRPKVYEALQLVYPRGLGAKGAATRMGCGVSNIHALLAVGDRLIAGWLADRDERQRLAREQSKKSFTT